MSSRTVCAPTPRPSVSLIVEFSGRPRQIGGLSRFLPSGAIHRFTLELIESEPGLRVHHRRWEVVALPDE